MDGEIGVGSSSRDEIETGEDSHAMTRAEAIALHESRFWEGMTARERAEFQLHEDRLCMPFDIFHQSVEEALGRPVWTHEFAQVELLRVELRGDAPAPTMEQIIDLIPAEKRSILAMRDTTTGTDEG